jgi:predicted esterase YcpF (UPF0227 family)
LLLYIHGFESSPQSAKIIELQQFLLAKQLPLQLMVEQQPATMAAQRAALDRVIAEQPIRAVMGSSLGGFWSHYAVSRLHAMGRTEVRAVLINPAVQPAQWMPQQLQSRQHPYTGEQYQLGPSDALVLQQVEQQLTAHVKLLVLLQKGDETLDYRVAAKYYQQQRMIIEQGGDHSFSGFTRYLPAALEFLHVL